MSPEEPTTAPSARYETPAAVALPGAVAGSVTPGASMNLLQPQSSLRSGSVVKPAGPMCSRVRSNTMIGRGWALAGKAFHAASAAVGGLGGESEGSGWAVPGPQAVSSTSATNHLGISEQRLQLEEAGAEARDDRAAQNPA